MQSAIGNRQSEMASISVAITLARNFLLFAAPLRFEGNMFVKFLPEILQFLSGSVLKFLEPFRVHLLNFLR
jgi:hypothetical protein